MPDARFGSRRRVRRRYMERRKKEENLRDLQTRNGSHEFALAIHHLGDEIFERSR